MIKDSMHFDGQKSVIIQPLFKDAPNSFTYELWVKPTATIEITRESQHGINGLSGQRYVIGPENGQRKDVAGTGISIGSNGIAIYEHTHNHLPAVLIYRTFIQDWTHVAVVYNNKIPFIYVNGVLKKRGKPSTMGNVYASGIFGGYKPYGYYSGFIKNIRIWNYPRSQEEILRDMHSNMPEQTMGLLGDWSFTQDKVIPFLKEENLLPINNHLSNIKVLFVRSGYDMNMPYKPLENGIINSLRNMTKNLHVATPAHNINIVSIADSIKPNLIIIFNGFQVSTNQVEQLRKTGAKVTIWMTDDPYYTDITGKLAPHYDTVFTQDSSCIPYYIQLGCRDVHHLPLAADMDVFYKQDVDARYKTDLLFIGSGFWNRIKFFDEIAQYLSSKDILISGTWWDRLSNYKLLKNKIYLNHWMSPGETAKYYNGAKIVINMHRSHEDETFNSNSSNIKALSINPRTFEISACGAFQLTDIRFDLDKFYTPNHEIETYTSPKELIEKIDYYLDHEKERKEIAARALQRTQLDHTFLQRVRYILNLI